MLKHVRICATAAAVVAALALTGCSSDDGGGSGKRKTDNSAAEDSGKDTSTGGSDGSDQADSGAKGSIDGLWVSVTNGKSVALSIQQSGKVAVLAEMGAGSQTGVTCVGKAGDTSGAQMIMLKCQGDGQREMGTVKSVDATSMTVAWAGVGTDEFKKSDKDQLPEGLPTGMPQEAPQG